MFTLFVRVAPATEHKNEAPRYVDTNPLVISLCSGPNIQKHFVKFDFHGGDNKHYCPQGYKDLHSGWCVGDSTEPAASVTS
jgi:hypothetical protein